MATTAAWAGKTNRILLCDWLPGQARMRHLVRSRLPAVSPKKTEFFFPCNNCHYWPSLFGLDGLILALFSFCMFMDLDSVSAITMQKKNLTNIKPSWPHAWSLTNIYQKWSVLVQIRHTTHVKRTGQFLYIQVCRHSVIVVASTKYPAHKLQTTWGFRSQILMTTYNSKIVPYVDLSLTTEENLLLCNWHQHCIRTLPSCRQPL